MAGNSGKIGLNYTFRELHPNDCIRLLKWRNDEFILDRSGSQKKVSETEHRHWFGELLNDENKLAYIIEVNDEPAGHLRLEPDDDGTVITLYLLESFTGKGLGPLLINDACSIAHEKWPYRPVVAVVRKNNHPARHAFINAGFSEKVSIDHADVSIFEYMSSELVEINTLERYHNLYEEHGNSFASLDWGSISSQQRRFSIIAGFIKDKSHVLDVGCGLGDFYTWSIKEGLQLSYTGIDITPDFIQSARNANPQVEFLEGSILNDNLLQDREFDYVIASGIFATYQDAGKKYVESCLNHMWNLCRIGIVFNSLSSWADNIELHEFHLDPLVITDYCRKFSHRIVLRHDYHAGDFTLSVLR